MIRQSITPAADKKAAKRGRIQKIKYMAAYLLAATSILSFFLPYMAFTFKNEHFSLTGLQLLTARGMRVTGEVIGIPITVRVAVGAGVLLAVAGILLLLFRKQTWASAALVLSSVTPLIVMLASNEIRLQAVQMNISKIAMTVTWSFVAVLVCGLAAAVLALWTKGGEQLAKSIFLVFACVSIGSVVVITGYMLSAGLPAIGEIGLFNFLFGSEWEAKNDVYGILPLILSSIAATAGAILIGVPIGLLTAIFLSETAKPRLAKVVRPAVELLAGIPSVIYGFFGMLIIVPFIRNTFPGKTYGDSLLAVILILAIMVLPTIVSVAETSLRAVPQTYREASLALGATPVATIFKVTVPAARSGILAGVILGVGRAVGETMAVIMVAGNVVNMPSLLGTVRLLTTGIVVEMSYSTGLHRQALFAIGLILFVFIIIVNLSFTAISKKGVRVDAE